ncbi:XRE family transcriptional regulator [Micromonospora sp. NPDC005313]|uniref:helix-turn-helix domain-containing protein n=1 Tax=Micromonospora sp. NPDC005313 TaxID=3154296 RepID=UPI0033ADF5FF
MPELKFEPARLRLARELKEWSQTQLANKVSVTAAALGQYESGTTRPSARVVTELSTALDVPVAFFEIPVTDTHDGFFRSTRRTPVAHRRHARALAHIARDLVGFETADYTLPPAFIPPVPPPTLEAPREEIEERAQEVRKAWGIPRGPVPNVVNLLENNGIVVLRLPLDTADVDAFSLPFPDHPVVVLGSDKNDRARSRFDAAHELGHLTLHGERVWGMKEVEKQAHEFAAAFLMPADEICDQLPRRVDWNAFFELKRRWQVSLAALLMRAKTLGRMSDSTYLTAVKAISARGWRRVEPVPLGAPERPSHLQRVITSEGARKQCEALPQHLVRAIGAANSA